MSHCSVRSACFLLEALIVEQVGPRTPEGRALDVVHRAEVCVFHCSSAAPQGDNAPGNPHLALLCSLGSDYRCVYLLLGFGFKAAKLSFQHITST